MTSTSPYREALAVAAAVLLAGCAGGGSAPAAPASSSSPVSSPSSHRFSVRAVLAERPMASPAASDPTAPSLSPAPGTAPTDPSDLAWLDTTVVSQLRAQQCRPATASGPAPAVPAENLTRPLVACSADGATAYALGPAEVTGADVAEATAEAPDDGSTSWTVALRVSASGAQALHRMTQRLATLPGTRNQAALVLDGVVVTAPRIAEPLTTAQLQISGGLDKAGATSLADRIRHSAR